MSLSTTPSEALTPMNKASPPTRKPGTGTAQPGGGSGEFAQLLRLQAQAEEAAPPERAASRAEPEEPEGQATAQEDKADRDEDAPTDKSKLPKKLQLAAEDLAADLRSKAAATAAPQLLADRARELAARQGAQARSQKGAGADQAWRPEGAEDERKADTGLRFGEALATATVPETGMASALRSTDKPERAQALPVLAEPVAPALPHAEPPVGLHSSPLPVEISTSAPLPTQATLESAPGTEAFNAALGAQLSVWVAEGVEMARLELNPRDLGPIEVRIALRDGQARVELGADVSSTREALAQALPALAEALGDVGVQLAGSGVSDQSSAQRQAQQEAGRQPSAALAALAQAFGRADGAANGLDVHEQAQPQGRPRSLVDLVA